MEKYIIAPPAGSQTNALGAKDRPWEEVHAKHYPGINEYLAESTGYGIVSGCEPSINGLTVTVSAGVIHTADGRRVEVPEQNITLDSADATNPRFDLVYLNGSGVVQKITGTAAQYPAEPVTTGIKVAKIRIAAGATAGELYDARKMTYIAPYGASNDFDKYLKYADGLCANAWVENYDYIVRDIELIKSMGIKMIRFDARWTQVETTKGVYDFSQVLKMAAFLVKNGIKPHIFIGNYADNTLYEDADKPSAFAQMAKSLVDTLVKNGYTGLWYTLQGEINGGKTYSEVYTIMQLFYTNIKEADSTAYVLAPVTYQVPYDWLKGLFSAGGLNYADAWGFDPYYGAINPEKIIKFYQRAKALMSEYADREIPIYCAEFGYSTKIVSGYTAATDEKRAQYLVRLVLISSAIWGHTNLYNLYTNEGESENPEDWFGIIHPDGTLSDTAKALQSAYSTFQNLAITDFVYYSDKAVVLKAISKNRYTKYIAWSTGDDEKITTKNGQIIELEPTPKIIDDFPCDTMPDNFYEKVSALRNALGYLKFSDSNGYSWRSGDLFGELMILRGTCNAWNDKTSIKCSFPSDHFANTNYTVVMTAKTTDMPVLVSKENDGFTYYSCVNNSSLNKAVRPIEWIAIGYVNS